MHSQQCYPPTCRTTSGSSGSRKISSPDPISCYSLSLASCSCPTLHSCVSHSLHSCVSRSHFRYPRLNALLLISVYKSMLSSVNGRTIILLLLPLLFHTPGLGHAQAGSSKNYM